MFFLTLYQLSYSLSLLRRWLKLTAIKTKNCAKNKNESSRRNNKYLFLNNNNIIIIYKIIFVLKVLLKKIPWTYRLFDTYLIGFNLLGKLILYYF